MPEVEEQLVFFEESPVLGPPLPLPDLPRSLAADIVLYEGPSETVDTSSDIVITSINPPAAIIRIGGRDYPWRTFRKCKTCISPFRETIENEVYAGQAYTAIVRRLPANADISPKSISAHVRGDHMPLSISVRAALVRERLEQQKRKIEDTEGSVVDHVLFCRAVVADAFQGMAEKGRRATMAEGLAAARVLALLDIEETGDGIDRQTLIGIFVSYMTAAARIMDPAQMEAFGAILRGDPRLRALQAQFNETDPMYQEAEAAEEVAETIAAGSASN